MDYNAILNLIIFAAGGISTGLVTAYTWELIQDRVPFIFSVSDNLSGYWISSFHPDTIPDSSTIELTKIRHRKSSIFLYQENYNSSRGRVWILRGRGQIRGSNICLHYYYDDKAYTEVGTFILNLKATSDGLSQLDGFYSQLINRSGIEGSIHHQAYMAKQCRVPLKNQLLHLFGRSHFPNYLNIKQQMFD